MKQSNMRGFPTFPVLDGRKPNTAQACSACADMFALLVMLQRGTVAACLHAFGCAPACRRRIRIRRCLCSTVKALHGLEGPPTGHWICGSTAWTSALWAEEGWRTTPARELAPEAYSLGLPLLPEHRCALLGLHPLPACAWV